MLGSNVTYYVWTLPERHRITALCAVDITFNAVSTMAAALT